MGLIQETEADVTNMALNRREMSPVLKEQIVCFHKESRNKSKIAKITQYDRSTVLEKVFEIFEEVC